jgi:hypothetical protein
MNRRRRNLILLVICGVVLLQTYILLKPALDDDPRFNLGYVLWKTGLNDYSSEYVHLIGRDYSWWLKLEGEPLDRVIEHYGIMIQDGSTLAADSYRGEYQERLLLRKPAAKCYWLDDADGFGWCFWVENGRIKKLLLVKG